MLSFFKRGLLGLGVILVSLGSAEVQAECKNGAILCEIPNENNKLPIYPFGQKRDEQNSSWFWGERCVPVSPGEGVTLEEAKGKCPGGKFLNVFDNQRIIEHDSGPEVIPFLKARGVDLKELRKTLDEIKELKEFDDQWYAEI